MLKDGWKKVLHDELNTPYMKALTAFVENERTLGLPVYPQKELVFSAFEKTPYEDVKVVIMGQDPYHGPGQAHGLSFSVPRGIKLPPSLKNIFKELASDLNVSTPEHGCLEKWSEQGVLLLNATLTVREGEPLSHYKQGWERFTDAVLAKLCQRSDPVIFVLWGKSAQEKKPSIARWSPSGHQHIVLSAPHPSPFSARTGFFGCRHFSKINSLLIEQGKSPIDWQI